jgi:hypothetical protein
MLEIATLKGRSVVSHMAGAPLHDSINGWYDSRIFENFPGLLAPSRHRIDHQRFVSTARSV